MPSPNLLPGLYLVEQPNAQKGLDHYAILDIGNRLMIPDVYPGEPILIHQTPPRVRRDYLATSGRWIILGQIHDERYAIARMKRALENPNYDLFGNNCEHFARYVATGKRESTQLKHWFFVGGVAALFLVMVWPKR